MTTGAYMVKRDIYARLIEATHGAGPLADIGEGGGPIQIKYDSSPADRQNRCIFAGGVEFVHDYDQSVAEGAKELPLELASIAWFIRVQGPEDVIDLERIAEQVGVAFRDVVVEDPDLRVINGRGDYSVSDEGNVVLLSYEVQARAMIE